MSTHAELLGGNFTERVSRGVISWKNFGALDLRPQFAELATFTAAGQGALAPLQQVRGDVQRINRIYFQVSSTSTTDCDKSTRPSHQRPPTQRLLPPSRRLRSFGKEESLRHSI